jgi:hypothetical protein
MGMGALWLLYASLFSTRYLLLTIGWPLEVADLCGSYQILIIACNKKTGSGFMWWEIHLYERYNSTHIVMCDIYLILFLSVYGCGVHLIVFYQYHDGFLEDWYAQISSRWSYAHRGIKSQEMQSCWTLNFDFLSKKNLTWTPHPLRMSYEFFHFMFRLAHGHKRDWPLEKTLLDHFNLISQTSKPWRIIIVSVWIKTPDFVLSVVYDPNELNKVETTRPDVLIINPALIYATWKQNYTDFQVVLLVLSFALTFWRIALCLF